MIIIQNLCKKFEDKVLFDNYNCSIPDSDFVVFCGESGCGKTTLLNMIINRRTLVTLVVS